MELEALLKDLPALETERLLLRKLRMEDAGDMYEYAIDPEIASMGMWEPFHSLEDSLQDLTETLEGYAKGTLLSWAIEYKAEQKMIGRVSLMPFSRRNLRAEIGYAMNRQYWGKGLMSEALRRLIQFAFTDLGLNRVEAAVFPDNPRSIAVLEKAGLKLEGVRRESTFRDGQFVDVNLYSLLKREWQQNR